MNSVLKRPAVFALFLLPAVLFYVVFMIYPIGEAIYDGFTKWNGVSEKNFIGLDNYIRLFQDSLFWDSLLRNFWFIVFAIVIQLPIIVFVALLISKVGRRFQSFYRTAVFTPVILSTAIVGILFLFIYAPDVGLLNNFLKAVGLDSWTHYWMSDPNVNFLMILIANAWQWDGFYIIIVLAAILNIPKELDESAEMDGANIFQRTAYITLPLIRPILIVVLLLSVAGSMKALDAVLVMTNGGPFHSTEVMATYMIKVGFQQFEYGYGSAIAVMIFLFTLIVSMLVQLLNRKDVEY
ncbi:MAG TPA: sugar ABC transporter permease [Bacillales bacterium]